MDEYGRVLVVPGEVFCRMRDQNEPDGLCAYKVAQELDISQSYLTRHRNRMTAETFAVT